MRPVRTPRTPDTLLGTGRGVDDLPAERLEHGVRSVWVPTPEERQAIAMGQNIELLVLGRVQPPVRLEVTPEQEVGGPPVVVRRRPHLIIGRGGAHLERSDA